MSEMRRGLISVFSSHPTAANLLMLVMIILGVFSLSRMNIQFMPTFGIDWVRVAVEWSGASADDVGAMASVRRSSTRPHVWRRTGRQE